MFSIVNERLTFHPDLYTMVVVLKGSLGELIRAHFVPQPYFYTRRGASLTPRCRSEDV